MREREREEEQEKTLAVGRVSGHKIDSQQRIATTKTRFLCPLQHRTVDIAFCENVCSEQEQFVSDRSEFIRT